jgi:hypothetical protein
MGLWRVFGLSGFCLLLVLSVVVGVGVAAGEAEAALKVGEAESAVGLVFEAVLEAEQRGADVSGLLVRLDSGGEFLAMAEMCLRNEFFDEAVYYADRAVQSVEGLVEDAEFLAVSAEGEFRERFLWAALVSGVVVGLIVIVGVLGWRLFRQRYVGNVWEMRPEVVEG